MTPETIKQIESSLAPLASKLGEGGAHLYEIYIKQMYIEGTLGIITGLLFVPLALWILLKVIPRARKRIPEYDWSSVEKNIGLSSAFCATLVILFVVVFSGIPNSLAQLINPEYYAIERILEQVKGE